MTSTPLPNDPRRPVLPAGPRRLAAHARPHHSQWRADPGKLLPQRFSQKVVPAIDRPFLTAIIFSLKTYAAALLALFISFWLGLDDPYWTLLTVYIVAQPDSGLVLAKSFYRLLGTAVGILITTALVFAFSQYGELFIASLALWIGLCSFAARGARNFAAYGFQLAGYTLAIVGLPAALTPDGAYTLIVARCTEISLGITCAALVSRLICPSNLAPKLFALVRELMHRVDRFADAAMDPAVSRAQLMAERARIANEFGTDETMRSSAFFESAEARLMNGPLQRATHAAIDLYAVAEEAAARLDRVEGPSTPEDLAAAFKNTTDTPRENAELVSALLRTSESRALARARTRLRQAAATLDRAVGAAEPTSPPRGLWSDPVTATLTGIRAALAVLITAAFWFATAWPSGFIAVLVAGVVCTLFAPMRQATKITLAAAATIVAAAIPVFVTQIWLLPYATDFVSMAVVLAPLLLICGFIIAQPDIGPLGLLSAVYLAVASHINNNNVATYDVVAFFNTSLAILFGLGVAVVLFATFFPETPEWASRRFRRQLRVHLSRLAIVRHPSFDAFELALLERLADTLARIKDESPLARDCMVSGAIVLSSGRAIDRLRTAIRTERLPLKIYTEVSTLLKGLSRTCLHPSWPGFTKSAWEARVVARHSLVKARTASDPAETDVLAEVVIGCETLRSNLLKGRLLLPENEDAF